jgi:hypothetical protein
VYLTNALTESSSLTRACFSRHLKDRDPRVDCRASAPACGEAARQSCRLAARGGRAKHNISFWRSGRPARGYVQRPVRPAPTTHEATYIEPRRATPHVQAYKRRVRCGTRPGGEAAFCRTSSSIKLSSPATQVHTQNPPVRLASTYYRSYYECVSESPSQAHCASKCQTVYFGLDTHLRSVMYQTRTRRGRARDESS